MANKNFWESNTSPFVSENDYNLFPKWSEQRTNYLNFKTRSDDIYVMTLPRSGTTLTLEMTWLICHNFDFKAAKNFKLSERAPRLETSLYREEMHDCKALVKPCCGSFELVPLDPNKSLLESFDLLPTSRIFKTHLPLSLLGDVLQTGAKVIYVARDPRDQLASLYRITCAYDQQNAPSFGQFWNKVKNNQMLLSPQWRHIKEAWAQRNNPNVLFMFYEDMRTNLSGAIRKVANFLAKPCTQQQIELAVRHLDITNFRKNVMVNKSDDKLFGNIFVGWGKVGECNDIIPEVIQREIDQWIDENIIGTDIIFPTFNKMKSIHRNKN